MVAPTADWLAQGVQGLPQELFDRVYIETFAADNEVRIVGIDYKPPHLLQVDRASRQLLAQTYYGKGAVFQTFSLKMSECHLWLKSLSTEYRHYIRQLRVDIMISISPQHAELYRKAPYLARADSAATSLTFLHNFLNGIVAAESLSVNVRFFDSMEDIWTNDPKSALRRIIAECDATGAEGGASRSREVAL